MPSKPSARSRATRTKRAVPRRELLRRVAVSVDMARDAATSTLGDLDASTQRQALLWIFSYLVGLSLGQLVTHDGNNHQLVERLADKAVAAGLEEYLECLQHLPEAAVATLAPVIAQLKALSRRFSGELPAGTPRLTLLK